ncbi:hypothetical protein ACKKBG_A18010 [Auxenochlorella protothecoides x Auxenochlorella symbiontica]
MAPAKRARGHHARQRKRSEVDAEEIKQIEAALRSNAPEPGTNPLSLPAAPEGVTTWPASRTFDGLPLSRHTKEGLAAAKFTRPTAVQRAVLPHALLGRDVLGAAKTGSGKTLAFLIPVLECLYRQQWGALDGLGALILTPTRELALQIFNELRKVGAKHEFSAGLLVGGKDVAEEQSRISSLNILVATPGRLLQHMDETAGFDCSGVKILVLDEADRILDLGFSAALNAIVENLPAQRQTLLFSATQTKSVKDLARLSLRSPEYLAVHAEAEVPTPIKLQQAYIVCPLQDKTDILWSFIRSHLKAKIIIFLSTCKQTRFYFEAFRKLRPGVPLRALHGRLNQYKRMGVFYDFCESKAMVLFATDIAARGLDFPTVDWVIQADCPEDSAAYIHRVGRTARYMAAGKSLLLLLPSESEGMLASLGEAKIPIKQLRHNPEKIQSVTPALQALLSKDAEIKGLGQRACTSYLRSVHLQPNRSVFDAAALPAGEYAASLGLAAAPKLRFLKRGAAQGPGAERRDEGEGGASDSSGEEEEAAEGRAHAREAGPSGPPPDEKDDFLVVKQRDALGVSEAVAEEPILNLAASQSTGKKKRLRIRPDRPSSSRMVFDEEGEAVDPLAQLVPEGAARSDEGHETAAQRAQHVRTQMAQRDALDKAEQRARRKEERESKRAKRLAREREEAMEGEEESASAASDGEESEEEKFGGRFRNGRGAELREEAGAEVAHMGMVPATLEDQEALALRLLSGRRGGA